MKKWLETVQPFPVLQGGRNYLVKVKRVKKKPNPKSIEVLLEFQEAEQTSRQVKVNISRPLRPQGLGAEFFTACDMDIAIGNKIAPQDALNTIITAAFEKDSASDQWQPIRFKRITKETTDELT